RQRADVAALFKAAKNPVDEPEREYRLPGVGGKPGYHDFFVLWLAAFGDQLDPVSKYHGAADDGLIGLPSIEGAAGGIDPAALDLQPGVGHVDAQHLHAGEDRAILAGGTRSVANRQNEMPGIRIGLTEGPLNQGKVGMGWRLPKGTHF